MVGDHSRNKKQKKKKMKERKVVGTIVGYEIEKKSINKKMREEDCHAPIPGPTRLVNPNRFRGAKPYTGTLYFFFFFFRAELIPVGIQTIFVITKNHLHIQKNYHRSGVHQILYIYTMSHLLIQTLIHIYV